jgi:hypothetical protein
MRAFFFASPMYSSIFLNAFSSMTAPMKLRKSRTSPIWICSIIPTAASRTCGQSDFGT